MRQRCSTTYAALCRKAPGSLSADEIYAVSAYILAEGKIIVVNRSCSTPESLPKVDMPNRDGFISRSTAGIV